MSIRFGFCVRFIAGALPLFPCIASAIPNCTHPSLPSYATLTSTLQAVVNAQNNGGFGLQMWATIVSREAVVCMVTRSSALGAEWPGSRVISAQKANTANAFSLPNLALSTANLYSAVQPGGSLFGLQESNPVNPAVAYAGDPELYGTINDALVGKQIGGVNVFGGGLALYDSNNGTLVGAIGVSGDSSCADHVIAWKVRHILNLDHVPGGPSGDPSRPDNIVYDIVGGNSSASTGKSASGWGHPHCLPTDVNPSSLPAKQ